MTADEDALIAWWESPPRFVREVFGVTPDPWQDEVLAAFPRHQRLSMKACKGPGKTAVDAWLAWNFLATRPDPKIAATSITAAHLAAHLCAQLAQRLAKSALPRPGATAALPASPAAPPRASAATACALRPGHRR